MSTKTSRPGRLSIASLFSLCGALTLLGCDAPVEMEEAELRGGGLLGETETCCWEWQDLPRASPEDLQGVSFSSGEKLNTSDFANGIDGITVEHRDEIGSPSPGLRLGARVSSSFTSFEPYADPDLLWVAAEFECGQGETALVRAYLAEGATVGPLFDVEEPDYFVGRFEELATECSLERIIGEKSVGNSSLRTLVVGTFDTSYRVSHRQSGRIARASDFNQRFIDQAYGETPHSVQLLAILSAGSYFIPGRGNSQRYRFGEMPWSPPHFLPGHYKYQADCGSGFETIREVDSGGLFEFDGTFDEVHDLYLEDFSYLLEDCEVRVGVYTGPEHLPNDDVGPL